MVPEAAIAMLACARIGAPHTVVFGRFSSEALADRLDDSKATLVITADGSWRRGQVVPLKANVDRAVAMAPAVEHVLVVAKRCANPIEWSARDVWWHDTVDVASPKHEPIAFDAEHPLFSLYTSGTTGKPKGILHTTGGYLTSSRTPPSASSISRTTTSTGAPPTSAGSPAIATSCTAHSRMARRY